MKDTSLYESLLLLMDSGQVCKNIITTTTNYTSSHKCSYWIALHCSVGLPLLTQLICNDQLSSTSWAKIGSLIDYTQKNPHKTLMMWNYLHSLLHFTPMSLTLIPGMYFSTPSSPPEEYAIDQAGVCIINLCVGRCAHVCVSCRWTALSFCFYILALLLLASVWGTYIPAVLEIHQPWQVYCTSTLHRLWPTTRSKISLSIRNTFMNRDGGGFELTAATNRLLILLHLKSFHHFHCLQWESYFPTASFLILVGI